MSENYEFIKNIGQGMCGSVCKARHILENKFYAIKKLNFRDISEKERMNIETEVQFLKELKHPNIVAYKDSFIDKDDNFNIVTSFCEGGDMYNKIFKQKNDYFDENIILNWLVQLLLGLSYIHDKKIIHRDIKTQNIFIQNEHILCIGDFGIAKIYNQTQTQTMTKIIGTPFYMSPESFKQTKKYSFKGDIWSLGCCIFEMCNFKHAFEGKSFPAVSVKVSEGKRAQLNPKYSSDLKKIVDSMLNLIPKNRPTIAYILERPFMKVKVGEYISDYINNCQKYGGTAEHIKILMEQADKFGIFKTNINREINKPNSKEKYNNYISKDYNSNENNMNNNYHLINKVKSREGKKLYSLDGKNNNNNNSINNNEIIFSNFKKNLVPQNNLGLKKSSGKMLNQKISEEQKKNSLKKKSPSQGGIRENKYNNKINSRRINTNFNNSKNKIDSQIESLNNNLSLVKGGLSKEKSNKKFSLTHKSGESKKESRESDRYKKKMTKQQSSSNYNNYEVENKSSKKNVNNMNRSKSILNDKEILVGKRISFFRNKCINGLGQALFNKAYNYLKNIKKNKYNEYNSSKVREQLIEFFGKDNIGYWQLIDQILLFENILNV